MAAAAAAAAALLGSPKPKLTSSLLAVVQQANASRCRAEYSRREGGELGDAENFAGGRSCRAAAVDGGGGLNFVMSVDKFARAPPSFSSALALFLPPPPYLVVTLSLPLPECSAMHP